MNTKRLSRDIVIGLLLWIAGFFQTLILFPLTIVGFGPLNDMIGLYILSRIFYYIVVPCLIISAEAIIVDMIYYDMKERYS